MNVKGSRCRSFNLEIIRSLLFIKWSMICILCEWNSSVSHHLIIIIVSRAKHSIPLFLISVLLALINWSCSPVVPRIRQTPIFGHNTTHAILEHLWLLIIIFHIFGDNLVANKIGQEGSVYQFLNGIWQKSIKLLMTTVNVQISSELNNEMEFIIEIWLFII